MVRKNLFRDRNPWVRAGYVFTVGWFLVVLYVTGGDQNHPFFDTIFMVPLAVWIVGVLVAHLLRGRGTPE
ncbi:MAG: hypothetical protein OQK23_02380, partial [Rhodospirillales bacterium]|nr:hypothetical protein [Rhodospirillales bacterium]